MGRGNSCANEQGSRDVFGLLRLIFFIVEEGDRTEEMGVIGGLPGEERTSSQQAAKELQTHGKGIPEANLRIGMNAADDWRRVDWFAIYNPG